MDGDTPPNTRFQYQNEFQKYDDGPCVFIGNITAAGTNLTLTSANQVIFLDVDWVPGNNAQAAKRAYRISQKRAVNVRYMAIANSVDQKVIGVWVRKIREIGAVLGR